MFYQTASNREVSGGPVDSVTDWGGRFKGPGDDGVLTD
jgi:hypothetical protein